MKVWGEILICFVVLVWVIAARADVETYQLSWQHSLVRTNGVPYSIEEIRNSHIYTRFWSPADGFTEWRYETDADKLTGEDPFHAIANDVAIPVEMESYPAVCFGVVTVLNHPTHNHSTHPSELPAEQTPCALAACHGDM